MTERLTEQDLNLSQSVFSSTDNADMELRYTRIALEEINKDFDIFTIEQARDLSAIEALVTGMKMRVRQ